MAVAAPLVTPSQIISTVDTSPTADHRLLLLAQTLSTSLKVTDILQSFFGELDKSQTVDGMRYSLPAVKIESEYGQRGRHRCDFELELDGASLGRVIFSRRNLFDAVDMRELETLLPALLYPLRNALRYLQSLQLAERDALTKLPNRESMCHNLEREIANSKRHHDPLSLLIIDIDRFKVINDTQGHRAGDAAIAEVAEIMNRAVRMSDIVFRYGGDEFVVLLSKTELKDCEIIAERMREAICAIKLDVAGEHISLTASVGGTQFHSSDDQFTFFDRADQALYSAKKSGRNCCEMNPFNAPAGA